MNQERRFGRMKKFFHKIFSYFDSLHPKYHLSLDNDFYDFENKKIIYCFKVFGDHSFVQFNFEDIKKNKSVLQNISPCDLIRIVNQEAVHNQKRNQLKIKEHLRNNLYTISDEFSSGVLSGDEVCDNMLLISRMDNADLYKIAYNTGFIRGRNFAKTLSKEMRVKPCDNNLIKFELVGQSR